MMYVLQVKSTKEEDIRKRLEELGYKALVPKGFKYKRIKGKWKESLDIIFKGYVFVDMKYTAENYYKVMAVDNVIRFLRSDDTPLTLNFIEVEWVRLLNALADKVQEVEFKDDEYTITGGVLKNFETNIVKVDKHKRLAYLEITLFNEVHKVALGIDIV